MPFDPDKYLQELDTQDFDPDAYLKEDPGALESGVRGAFQGASFNL